MKAAVLSAYNEPLVIEDLTAPDLNPDEVRVQIDASGVCHSDVTVANGGVPMPPPIILGHEGAGHILEVGSNVTRVKVGDKVICSFTPACGVCWFCLRDQSNLCERANDYFLATRGLRADGSPVFGMTGLGTFTDEMVTAESMVVKVETDLPAEQLALIGCGVTTGVGAALNTAKVQPGSTVAVIGCGGVGQAVIQGARIAGASRIFAIDPVELKRKTAEQLGATDLIDPAKGDPVQQVKDATGGRGTDYAFEVIGLAETIVQAYNTARRGGTAVIVGMA
ncbi:MAG: S-(hydroxymethyl)glutathione dehydrogenase / alcohol dehydrogenase, partial [Acidimicrobiaceae bacterium]